MSNNTGLLDVMLGLERMKEVADVSFVAIEHNCKCYACVRATEKDDWETTEEGKKFKADYIALRDGGMKNPGQRAYNIMVNARK